jgi:multiple sugar transport system permease protein
MTLILWGDGNMAEEIIPLETKIKPQRKQLSKSVRESIIGYIFILPAALVIGLFVLYPTIRLFSLSFTDSNLLGGKASFIGISSYLNLIQDPDFINAFKVSFTMAIIIIPTQTALALFMAVQVNKKLKGVNIFRTIYFIPAVTSFVAVTIFWKQIYNTDFGLANTILTFFKLPAGQFLSSPDQAMLSVIITCVWKAWGYFMVIFIAGLQGIPGEVKEAAVIDGANSLQEFWYIILPMLKRTILFVAIITTMDAIRLFIPSYTMTAGGPMGKTDTLVYYIWRTAFRLSEIGSAAAMAVVLFIVILVITIVQFKVTDRD